MENNKIKFIAALFLWLAIFSLQNVYAAEDPTKMEIAKMKAFVDSAADYVRTHGKTEALKEFSNPHGKFVGDNGIYIFAYNYEGVCVANGGNPGKFVGKNLINFRDPYGTPVIRLIVETAKNGGGYIRYYWPLPNSSTIKYKTSYIEPYDKELILGAGIYSAIEVPLSREAKIEDLKAFVNSGLSYMKEHGGTESIKEFNDPQGKFIRGDWYIFVCKYDGTIIAHGGDPKKYVGTNIFNAKDEFGLPFFQMFIQAAKAGGGLVGYYWPRQDTGKVSYKNSYIMPVNDKYLIGAGFYDDDK